MATPRILAFAGSLRTGSFNRKLVAIAAAGAERAGAEVTMLDLRAPALPVYDGDVEAAEGLPAAAVELKALFRAHQGLLIASPEYNSSISAALKNMIDWVSRPEEGRPSLDCFTGKVAGIMSAAAGGLGGMRGLPHLRAILQNINVLVVPKLVAISAAHEVFNDDGGLRDERKQQAAEDLGAATARLAARLLD